MKNLDSDTDHGEKFSFNENVTSCFSNMLERSIPSYDLMRELTSRIIKKYIFAESLILDIGTSTGEVIYDLSLQHPKAYFIGLENSDSMIVEAKKRFKDLKNVDIRKHDLRKNIHFKNQIDIAISSLTIQFTPIEYRLQILKNIYDALTNKGVFIFIEKVLGASAEIDTALIDTYYNIKIDNGYSFEEIQRKKLALEGVLVPVTSKWNEELLHMSGFSQVDCFWRCLNFCGWIAIK